MAHLHVILLEMTSLFGIHVSLHALAQTIAASFLWVCIFLIQSGRGFDTATSMALTGGLFAISAFATVILAPWCARFVRIGINRSLILACGVFGAALLPFSSSLMQVEITHVHLVLLAIAIGFYNACYWTPYQLVTYRPQALDLIAVTLAGVVPAIIGSLVLNDVPGISMVLSMIGVLLFLSTLPLLFAQEHYERFSWSYRELFARLPLLEHRRLVMQSVCTGIERTTIVLLLPLFFFMLFGMSFALLGLVMSANILLAVLFNRFFRLESLAAQIRRSALIEAVVRSGNWVLRLIVATPLGVIAVQAVASPFEKTHAYPHAETYIDEYSALSSLAQSLGALLCASLFAWLIVNTSIVAAFVAAFVLAGFAAGVHAFARR